MRIVQTVKQFFTNIKQIKIDKDNRKKFLEDIKIEIIDPTSVFNQLKLQCDEGFNSISCITNIPENFQLSSTDIIKYHKLSENVRPVNKYLIQTLNWGDYFCGPEFYYIDNIDEPVNEIKEVSCSYIATWTYHPILDKYPNFKYQLATFAGINAGILAAIILLIILL